MYIRGYSAAYWHPPVAPFKRTKNLFRTNVLGLRPFGKTSLMQADKL